MSITRYNSNYSTSSETIPFDCPPTTKNPDLNKSSHQEKIEECIDPTVPEGEVGVNLADMAITALKSCIPEMSTDIDNLTVRNASILANFLEQNGCSVEAQSFAHMAIEAYNNDGEVDYEKKIMFTPDWKIYDCQKNIVKETYNGHGEIGQTINLIFSDEEIFKNEDIYLNYDVEELSNQSNGSRTLGVQNTF